jgi:hypothetical protein
MQTEGQNQHAVPFRHSLNQVEQMAFDRLPVAMQNMQLFAMIPTDDMHRATQHEALMTMALGAPPPNGAQRVHTGVGSKLKDVPKPEMYRGSQQGNAARHWLRDCERYFETRAELAGEEEEEGYKVIIGRTHLAETALIAWRGLEVAVESGHMQRITTWDGFRAWILENFEAKTAEADRYRAYITRLQKSDNFSEYFRKLQEASLNLQRPADSYSFILQLVSGLNHELRAEWYKLQDPPTEVTEVHNRLLELERGCKEAANTRGNRFFNRGRGQQASQPRNDDAMDLSAMDSSTRSFKCYNCGKPGHLKRDCRLLKEGKAEGQ